jgi:hypothetical protein
VVATEVIAECIGSCGIWEAESNMELLNLDELFLDLFVDCWKPTFGASRAVSEKNWTSLSN